MDDSYKFTYKSRFEKAIKTLQGLIEGITIDSIVNQTEIDFLNEWIETHNLFRHKHPFNEVIPLLEDALDDKVLTTEEQKDIIWLCNKLSIEESYFDYLTNDMQRFHGILTGIISDGIITDNEVESLKKWVFKNEHLKTLWPYDELESILISIMEDGVITNEEKDALFRFLYEFSDIDDDKSITDPIFLDKENLISGVCSIDPNIQFESKTFVFTGKSEVKTREELYEDVMNFGGTVKNNISKKIDYLVIGSAGNPCWTYSCYGRKVEKAVQLRKKGVPLVIVHEIDFLDALIQ